MCRTVSFLGQVELIWRKHESHLSLSFCGLSRLCHRRRPAVFFWAHFRGRASTIALPDEVSTARPQSEGDQASRVGIGAALP